MYSANVALMFGDFDENFGSSGRVTHTCRNGFSLDLSPYFHYWSMCISMRRKTMLGSRNYWGPKRMLVRRHEDEIRELYLQGYSTPKIRKLIQSKIRRSIGAESTFRLYTKYIRDECYGNSSPELQQHPSFGEHVTRTEDASTDDANFNIPNPAPHHQTPSGTTTNPSENPPKTTSATADQTGSRRNAKPSTPEPVVKPPSSDKEDVERKPNGIIKFTKDDFY